MRLPSIPTLITPLVLLALAVLAVFHYLAPPPPLPLSASPANAFAWARQAELLAAAGNKTAARAHFDRALELAPQVPHILMRTVNFCYENGDVACTLSLGRRVLALTATFDTILFIYYADSHQSPGQIFANGVPPEPRAVRSFVIDQAQRTPGPAEFLPIWRKALAGGFIDDPTAATLSAVLLARKFHPLATTVWLDHLPRRTAEVLFNSAFARPPLPSPFDWNLGFPPGVTFERTDGLNVVFDGSQNVALGTPSQMTPVEPGSYRLLVDCSSTGLTTDQTPFFRAVDPAAPQRLNAVSGMVPSSGPRRTITLDFAVPKETTFLVVRAERTPSAKLDNLIAGSLHIFSMRLTRLGN